MRYVMLVFSVLIFTGCNGGGGNAPGGRASITQSVSCSGPAPQNRMVSFGDSLTAGVAFNPNDRYTDIVANAFGLAIENRGVPGMVLQDQLLQDHIDRACLTSADTVTMMVCYNDQRTGGMDATYFTNSMAALSRAISKFKARGVTNVFIAGCLYMHPSVYHWTGVGSDAAVDMYNVGIKNLVNASGYKYIDVETSFNPSNVNYWDDDHSHLNVLGQSTVAQKFIDEMN